MRTTIDIDQPVLKELKRRGKAEGKSLGRLTSELLAEALAAPRREEARPAFTWVSRPMFAQPLAPEEAMANVETLLSLRHVRVLAEEDGFWGHFRAVAGLVRPRGNLVPDVHLAALLKQHGVPTIYTHDRDFRKFDFLKVADPFKA